MLTNQHLCGKIDLLIFQQVYFCRKVSKLIGRFEVFTLGLSELSTAWNKIATEELKPFGLKGGYVVYLIALYKTPEGLTSARLCELCNRDKAEVSRAVSALEKKGMVVRETATGNGYRARIQLTKEGRAVTCALRERIKLAVEKGGTGLSEEERDHFYSAMQTIARNLKEISRNGLKVNENKS